MHLLNLLGHGKLRVAFGRATQARVQRRGMCFVVALDAEPIVEAGKGFGKIPFWHSSSPRPPISSMKPSACGSARTTALRIDGKAMASEIRREILQQVTWMSREVGKVPGLAMIMVGNRKDSQLYVRGKQAACEEVGIKSHVAHLPSSVTEADVLEVVEKFNGDVNVHGILVQLPLPSHIKAEVILTGVNLEKDVDGLHPVNLGRLALGRVNPTFVPCTPLGCIEMLLRTGIEIENKHAVVIGCSNVVGFPIALLLQRRNASVTVVHIDSPNPVEISQQADILISATGVAHLVRGHWVKPGAVVIDVGTSTEEDLSIESGFRVTGDVCFEEAERVASAITPVPGGVGPMTIAMLLSNTLKAALQKFSMTSRRHYLAVGA